MKLFHEIRVVFCCKAVSSCKYCGFIEYCTCPGLSTEDLASAVAAFTHSPTSSHLSNSAAGRDWCKICLFAIILHLSRPAAQARRLFRLHQIFIQDGIHDITTNSILMTGTGALGHEALSITGRCRKLKRQHSVECLSEGMPLKRMLLSVYSIERSQKGETASKKGHEQNSSYLEKLPMELLLKIFSYLPFNDLITMGKVCRQWEIAAYDWKLWSEMKRCTIDRSEIKPSVYRKLLNFSPNLQHLRLYQRNDIDKILLKFDIKSKKELSSLEIVHCSFFWKAVGAVSKALSGVLLHCPKLKFMSIKYTSFHSKMFYEVLAKNFLKLEHIGITCTTRHEMMFFIRNLRTHVPDLQFDVSAMMGRGANRSIYWGPVNGLQAHLLPCTPHFSLNTYPRSLINYAY